MYLVSCDQCSFNLEVGSEMQAEFVAKEHAEASEHTVSFNEVER